MAYPQLTYLKQPRNGFTLIEVMLVIVLVGLMVSMVQFTFQNNQADQRLSQESKRFAGTFEMAAEYGMLNNVELGLLVTESSYEYLGYDGTQWTPVSDFDALAYFELPEDMELTLTLDDLPLEQPSMVNVESFKEEEDDFKPDEEKVTPQVVILSGGDISPFSVSFSLIDVYDESDALSYKVTGLYTTPLEIDGPLTLDGRDIND